jgi:hypothetical protein
MHSPRPFLFAQIGLIYTQVSRLPASAGAGRLQEIIQQQEEELAELQGRYVDRC